MANIASHWGVCNEQCRIQEITKAKGWCSIRTELLAHTLFLESKLFCALFCSSLLWVYSPWTMCSLLSGASEDITSLRFNSSVEEPLTSVNFAGPGNSPLHWASGRSWACHRTLLRCGPWSKKNCRQTGSSNCKGKNAPRCLCSNYAFLVTLLWWRAHFCYCRITPAHSFKSQSLLMTRGFNH